MNEVEKVIRELCEKDSIVVRSKRLAKEVVNRRGTHEHFGLKRYGISRWEIIKLK